MQRIKPWLERDFFFDTPQWMFPHVIERVRGLPTKLEDGLRDLSSLGELFAIVCWQIYTIRRLKVSVALE